MLRSIHGKAVKNMAQGFKNVKQNSEVQNHRRSYTKGYTRRTHMKQMLKHFRKKILAMRGGGKWSIYTPEGRTH